MGAQMGAGVLSPPPHFNHWVQKRYNGKSEPTFSRFYGPELYVRQIGVNGIMVGYSTVCC